MCTTANYLICNMEEPIIAIYVLFCCGLNFLQNVSIKIECILFSKNMIELIKLKYYFLNRAFFVPLKRD